MIRFRSDFDVELVSLVGDDELICRAARVSTLGGASMETDVSTGLLRFLMSNRHGSPFEHAALTMRITQPIFSWREQMRHRIGFSYNEESGRYKKLEPVFYIPGHDRKLVQEGKPGAYVFVDGTPTQHQIMQNNMVHIYKTAWAAYEDMMYSDVAKEVARMVLPVAIYSTAYVTMNPRSLMSFLSLRTKHEGSTFPSYPQWEINRVADQMEAIFAEKFPVTHAAFNAAGRVAP